MKQWLACIFMRKGIERTATNKTFFKMILHIEKSDYKLIGRLRKTVFSCFSVNFVGYPLVK